MSERKQPTDREIEALVSAHLAQQEATVDAGRILVEVRARMAASASRGGWLWRQVSNVPHLSLGYSGRLALAAAILLAILWGLHVDPGHASAITLVQDAQKVHAQPIDRCYEIQTQLEPALMETYGILPTQPRARLWTRGDRFWVESLQGKHGWSMGRDEQGRVWFASLRGTGFRFQADEVPEPLRIACELRSMRIETLLREVLVDFDLREEMAPPGHAKDTRMVRATLKPDRHRALRAVTIEMENASKVLKRVVLSRTYPGGAASTVTFTLVAEGHQKDEVYRLEGHVNAEGSIDSTEEVPRRLQRLLRQIESTRP